MPNDLFKLNEDYQETIPKNSGLIITGYVRGRFTEDGKIIILEEDLKYIRIINLDETSNQTDKTKGNS
jgi:hypothetical protein